MASKCFLTFLFISDLVCLIHFLNFVLGRYYRISCLKSTTSEDTSSEKTPLYADNEPQFNFRPLDKKEEENDDQPNGEGTSFADNLQLTKFLDDIDVKV